VEQNASANLVHWTTGEYCAPHAACDVSQRAAYGIRVAAARRFQLYWIYVVLLAFVLIAWMARWLVERRRGLISISDPVCCVRRSSASSISFSMFRRDLLKSSIDLSDPCLVIIELFLEFSDLCMEMVMALLQPFLKAFYFVWSQFTDVETSSDKVTH
jgi:hypothetical protein